jgi:Tol biopolymer transport system component
MAIPSGSHVGRYEILGLLGAGGMGEVYRALDPRLGRDVAVKVLPSGLALDAERLRRLEQEARAVAALNHPHILAIHDTGSHDGSLYVVSELLDGKTLGDRLSGGALPIRKAIEIAVQIARGLSAAHEKGIVHRDLKPENVFVTRDGNVKILDFGLAKLKEPSIEDEGSGLSTRTRGTDPGTVMGTASYMSPEQVRGQPADHRSDIFSLGAILYEMLSGRRAFKRETSADTMAAVLNEEPPDLTAGNVGLPPGLERIVWHCLEKDRDERFASARDLVFDLQSLSDTSGPAGIARTAARGALWQRSIVLLLWTAAVSATAFWLGRSTHQAQLPSFRPLTFRRGAVTRARFAPDGSYFFYSAAWGGGPARVYSTRIDVPGDQDLGLEGDLMGAAAGELFVLRPDGVLVRATLVGKGAREVAADVSTADVSRDGHLIAVVRHTAAKDRLECPLGKVLYETSGSISSIRFSPKGDRLAFAEVPNPGTLPASVGVLNLDGQHRVLTKPEYVSEPVWSPDGTEIWFGAGVDGRWTVRAVSLSGGERVLLQTAQQPRLGDVHPDSHVLLAFDDNRAREVRGLRAGMGSEREILLFGAPECYEIGTDGRTLVLTGGGNDYDRHIVATYLGTFEDTPPVRLGPGLGAGLSPDGRFVAVMDEVFSVLAIVPTGPGETRRLPAGTLKDYYDVRWLPDGHTLVIAGSESGRPRRLFLQDVGGGLPRPLTPEGVSAEYPIPSPDGQWVTASEDWRASASLVYPLGGGEPRPILGLQKGEQPLRFDGDGTHLFIRTDSQDQPLARIARLDLRTGRKEPWKEIRPPDPAGVSTVGFVYLTPDGQSYVYGYPRLLSTLYVSEGLR